MKEWTNILLLKNKPQSTEISILFVIFFNNKNNILLLIDVNTLEQ